MPNGATQYDEHGLTINQKKALELIEPGVWFDPEDYKNIRHISSRNQFCKQLADKNVLLKRPYSDLGYVAFEYMLPATKAAELGIVRKVSENG